MLFLLLYAFLRQTHRLYLLTHSLLLSHILLLAMSSSNINHLPAGLPAGNQKPKIVVEIEIPCYKTIVMDEDEDIEDDDGNYFHYDEEDLLSFFSFLPIPPFPFLLLLFLPIPLFPSSPTLLSLFILSSPS